MPKAEGRKKAIVQGKGNMPMEQRTITVKAAGKASGRPDRIVIPMTLAAGDRGYQKTMALAAEKHEALKSALGACGFAADEVKTAELKVDTRYESEPDGNGMGRQRITGYVCTYRLQVEFDLDMTRLGRVMEALSGSAAQASYSMRFTVKDTCALMKAALCDAAKNARVKAEALAAASGAALGELVRIDHTHTGGDHFSETQMAVSGMARKAYVAEDITPDDVNITESAAFVWELL